MPATQPCNYCEDTATRALEVRRRVGTAYRYACTPCLQWLRDHRLVVGGTTSRLGCTRCEETPMPAVSENLAHIPAPRVHGVVRGMGQDDASDQMLDGH